MKSQASPEPTLPAGAAVARPTPGGIVIVSSGGLTHGGGIGSITRLIHAQGTRLARRVDVLDGRGEHRAGALWSLVYVPWALCRLVVLRALRGSTILHLQVSERSSFYRKGIFLLCARLMGMRAVLHHHGAEMIASHAQASPLLRWTMSTMAQHVEMNIVLGQVWQRFLTEQLNAPEDKVRVLYNAGRDFRGPSSTPARDPWQFLIAANLVPRKGIGELLQAIAALAADGWPVRLTLAGGGQVERYRAEAAALRIEDRCVFTGWLQDPAQLGRLFADHAALVLPSHAEGMPIAIIEALGAGLPIVTTPVGSIPEILDDAQTCLMVEPRQAAPIALALRRLATDEVLRQTLATNGRALYERLFSEERYTQALREVYQHIA